MASAKTTQRRRKIIKVADLLFILAIIIQNEHYCNICGYYFSFLLMAQEDSLTCYCFLKAFHGF